MRYAPLHNHTVYSVKDATAKVDEYVERIYEYNASQTQHEIVGLAITEHSNLYSMIDHHLACKTPVKGGIYEGNTLHQIYGNEIYHIDSYANKEKVTGKDRYHLVLLAKNEKGLENLFAITTEAGLNKVKGKTKDFQLVEEKFLETHGEGIIALSACLGGKIPQLIVAGDYEGAKKLAWHFNSIFEEFYLEIQPHDILPEQVLVNDALMKIHNETGIPIVITSDSHYVRKEDKKYHDLLKEIDHMKGFKTDSHMWTPDELIEWCNNNGIPLEAIENTAKIADSCIADITPKDPKGLMPSYPCPPGYNEDSYLTKLANDGLLHRFTINKKIKDIRLYISRMNYELSIIIQMGFSGYFLILWDWFKWCKENNVLLGPGRGSAAGSVVAYFLDITKIDPIENGLIFERFLNPMRIEEPDIDTDVSKLDRPKAIKYLEDKYGKDYVCQIATFGQYKLKNTIKAVLSAEKGYTAEFQNSITKQIPDLLSGNPVTYDFLEDVVNFPEKHDDLKESEVAQCNRVYTMLQELFSQYPEVEMAVKRICGAISSIGAHAGGVVISSKPLSKHIPLMKGGNAAVLNVSQFNMDGIHYFHGLKIDALGLKTLSQINLCMQLANIDKSWLDDEDTSDPAVYKSLREGNTINVFQMSKHVPTQMIKDFEVDSLDGLNAVNAGNRPGPLAKGQDGKSMVDKYGETVKTGKIISIDSRIDPILEDTNGQLWYQEQLMALGQKVCGYSLGNADLRIRKVVAKKDKKKIPEIRNEFVYGKASEYDKNGKVIGLSDKDSPYCIGAIANGFEEGMALKLFKDIEAFAAYCFNKSHSAAYAFVGYRTAWLNYYYPVEWSIACMTLDTIDGKTESVTATLNSCKKRNIKILPPDINDSGKDFSVAHLPDGTKAIRYGLLAIKGVGLSVLKATKKLIEKDGEFTSFDNFLDRTLDPQKNSTLRNELANDPDFYNVKELEDGTQVKKFNNPFKKGNVLALIQSGAFDSLESNRFKLINDFIKFRNIKKELETETKDEDDYKLRDKLSFELELLGYYVSQHPLDGDVFPYVDLSQAKNNQQIKIAGLVKEFKKNPKPTKTGKTFYKLLLEFKDGTSMYLNIWDNIFTKYASTFKGLNSKAKMGKAIVIVEGKFSVNKGYTNINVTSINQVISQQEELEETDIPDNSEGVPELEAKTSPLDEDLMLEVGVSNA